MFRLKSTVDNESKSDSSSPLHADAVEFFLDAVLSDSMTSRMSWYHSAAKASESSCSKMVMPKILDDTSNTLDRFDLSPVHHST